MSPRATDEIDLPGEISRGTAKLQSVQNITKVVERNMGKGKVFDSARQGIRNPTDPRGIREFLQSGGTGKRSAHS